MKNLGTYFQIEETGISGTYTLNLENQMEVRAYLEINGDTTLKMEKFKNDQMIWLDIKFNGNNINLSFDNTQFCCSNGIIKEFPNHDGALNRFWIMRDRILDSCIILDVFTNLKAITL